LDADNTLYDDGKNIEENNPIKEIIINLLKADENLNISILTAAGYPNKPERYEERFEFLLKDLSKCEKKIRERFFVIGGECNYCFQVDENGKLVVLEDKLWKTEEQLSWKEEDIQKFLNDCKNLMEEASKELGIFEKYTFLMKVKYYKIKNRKKLLAFFQKI
jgi:IMP and pyridine-specific 5'-nucleotidase